MKRPAVWPGFVVWIGAVIASVVVSLPIIGVMAFVHFRGTKIESVDAFNDELGRYVLSAPVMVAGAAANALTFVAVAFGAAWIADRRGARIELTPTRLDLGPSSFSWLRGAGASIGVVGVSLGVHLAASSVGLGRQSTAVMMNRAFAHATPVMLVLSMIAVGVIAPAAEEVLFRGFLLPVFAKRWGPIAGIAISAAMFGITHLDPLQGTFAFLVGLYLGWLALRCGSIRWPIVAHVVNNTVAVVSSRIGGRESTATTIAVAAMALTATVVGLLSTHGLRRRA
jgi:membrane protease YdiL (CAAX protease family)